MAEQMDSTPVGKRGGYLAIGGIGLLFSIAYLGMSAQLPFGQMDQPGAGIFPVAAGSILLLASLATIWEGWQAEASEQVEFPAGADRRRVLALVGMLLGYFLLLPWAGQLVGSTLFCMLLMRLLSSLHWLRVVLYSVVMSAAVYAVFVHVLKVPMPQGVLGL